ncbi:MAG TPA: FAD-binding oxidoreductase [Motilibacterales bacterium]|nr:FAD-binding oxidoreductase [Motilibacterales bacterium]
MTPPLPASPPPSSWPASSPPPPPSSPPPEVTPEPADRSGSDRLLDPRDLPVGLRHALDMAGVPVVTDPDQLAGHCVDWTGRWRGPALGAVRPRTTEQVAAVLLAARAAGVVVQVQGGNTGLVGGSVPDRPALLLLTSGLDILDPVDRVERTVVAGAGVSSARVAAHARAAGLHFGVDLASRDSATVGGMVATNAGGMGVCAFGMMRDQVRGLVAVLADGRVVRSVGRPRKDNCGYDLAALLVGSEGTLGVVTEVEIALHPRPAASSVALLAVADLADAVRCAHSVQAGSSLLLAAEVVDAAGVARASRALGQPDPLPAGAPWLLLLEVADGATAEALEPVGDRVVAVATGASDRQRLWALRERQSELYGALPGLQKLDVSLRLADLDAAVTAIRSAVAAPGRAGGRRRCEPDASSSQHVAAEPWVGIFGHALDGNLHVQLVGADEAMAGRILEVVAGLGGSISAEHGIGRQKADQLQLSRSTEQVGWMRAIKATVDPAGLLNPGVLFAHADPAGPVTQADPVGPGDAVTQADSVGPAGPPAGGTFDR